MRPNSFMPNKISFKAFTKSLVISLLCPFCMAFAQDPYQNRVESCSTSMCHGGASSERYQMHVWLELDPHAQSGSSLISSWGEAIAKELGILSADQSDQCINCHTPYGTNFGTKNGEHLKEGVNCVSCHGAPERWFFTHTRPDYDAKKRYALGMENLKDSLSLGEKCASCHLEIDPKLIQAGHPSLVFDLGRDFTSLPSHWKNASYLPKGKLWLVGEFIAFQKLKDRKSTEILLKEALKGSGYQLEEGLSTVAKSSWDASKTEVIKQNLLLFPKELFNTLSQEEQFFLANQLSKALIFFCGERAEKLKELCDTQNSFDLEKFYEALKALQDS